MQTQKPAASPPPPLADATPPAPSQGEAGEQQRQDRPQPRDHADRTAAVCGSGDRAGDSPCEDHDLSPSGAGSADPEPSSSEELDDSGDENFSQTSSGDDDDEEALTAESAPSTEESEEDLTLCSPRVSA
ncbi:hypothetical protein PHYSODRAFT_326698 [Phytophthora sojae]|uniref:Uncharacterized protein n=1 Tax=Phytophthora sojae (strain P6497) TaxID=1094619 RepID=G4YY06_PHYSP|nr:hypothetical protein PHYSODRAFT_326698 [Phytophthora sojae]EGZ25709.1 hypothetical protein PHYSODRAFT_326698 [Phytophthora sojae]|eukprot:XP_009520997.1 hypothetical protein PHYSODRAFT_326698 [Phytophthora sojae]